MHLYFVAITAPPAVDHEVLQFKQTMLEQYGCRVALRSPAHITLIPPFNLPDAEVHQLKTALDNFAGSIPDFVLELKDFSCFPPRVIYVDVVHNESLKQVQSLLEVRLLPYFPVKKSTRPFHPHVTIANRDLDKSHFEEAWRHFKDQAYNVQFPASGISLLQYNGNRWQTIHTAPLTG
ncbi:MAG: RNA 2',3'-cyclic phosphodiesterase [Williamsia sp.]|nr:RNA 2',3'-cyclic phosphodiesterase [Williamsia sp.]